MKIYVFLIHVLFIISASAQFELQSPITKLLSDGARSSEQYLDLRKNFRENHLLNQLVKEQDIVTHKDNSELTCFKAIGYLLSANLQGKSFQFFDAWGRIPAGILYGHLIDLGNFNECLSARATIKSLNQEIRGKYVLVEARPVGNKTANVNDLNPFSLKIGTCFPNVCSDNNVTNIFRASSALIAALTGTDQETKIDFFVAYSKTEDEHKSYNAASITAITIFSMLGALMLFSTLYEYAMLKKKTAPNQLLMSFSILTNGRKLFQINTNSNSNNIECLNGLRVISMLLIIYGHSHLFVLIHPMINTIDALSYLKSPVSVLAQASPFAVDSFLLISGLLITWVALPKMEKTNGKLNIPLMYFHRYIRLTPVLAVAILFTVGIWPLMDKGPFLFEWTLIEEFCIKNWWINFLYINNYLDAAHMCLGHVWYLAVDMQLFLISPFILMGLCKCKSKFLWILLLIALLSIGCCIMTMISNNFTGIIIHGIYDNNQTRKIHFPTHIRIPPWLIGVALGYWLYNNQKEKQHWSRMQLTIGWIVALSLFIAVSFGPFHFSQNLSKATKVEAALFAAFGHSAWSLGLAWIIFVCHSGYSRTLNSFLSYAGWQPFVRLTYTMYIVSIMLQMVNAAYNRTDNYFSAYNILNSYWSEVITTMGWAVLVVLSLESPIIAIEKYFLGGKKPKSAPIPATTTTSLPAP